MNENFASVTTLFNTVLKKFQQDIHKNLAETFGTWHNDSESPCNELLFEFAMNENDRNFLNVFMIPEPKQCETREIMIGYKIGGMKLDSSEVYHKTAPYGVDTYERCCVVAKFQIKL